MASSRARLIVTRRRKDLSPSLARIMRYGDCKGKKVLTSVLLLFILVELFDA